MTAGRLRCCGSSLFLKAKFGIGYLLKYASHLELSTSISLCVRAIARLVHLRARR